MTDPKQAWDEVRDNAVGLGMKLKLHFEQARSQTGEGADEVRDALEKLRDAIDGAFDAVGRAARDDAVREDVKETGRSLSNALQATFAEASDELKKAFTRRGGGQTGGQQAEGDSGE